MEKKPTRDTMNRREFFKVTGIVGGGALTATTMIGCSPEPATQQNSSSDTSAQTLEGIPTFLKQPEAITDFAKTHDYDVVVVGAGVSGMAAALSAAEKGVKVACIQKEAAPSSQGNMGSGVDLNQTSEAGVAALESFLTELNDHRSNRSLINKWTQNSFEALDWFESYVSRGGIEVNEDEPDANRIINVNGYDIYLHANTYFRIGHDEVVKAVAPLSEEAGVEFYFETPAVQLITSESGGVTGVVGETASGDHILFNASKGVILATGDYQCDREMVEHYCPDVKDFPALQLNRTGDGHKMGVWAGGKIEPIPHTKMIHDARISRADAPYLLVNYKGERFMCEGPLQGYLNNYVRSYIAESGDPLDGTVYSVVDANWEAQAAAWKEIDPAVNIRTCVVYYEGQSIEEACEAAAVDGYAIDAQAVKTSVARYNELVTAGADADFGKRAEYLAPIDTPPFKIIPHDFGYGLSAIIGGLEVDEDSRVLSSSDSSPIQGLYAVGNCAGLFYGGVDYPMDVLGLSIGRAITGGYVTGALVASL